MHIYGKCTKKTPHVCENHFDDGSDSMVDYDWLTDFTLRVELKQNRTIKIQYNPDTDSLEVDNLST